MRTSFSKNVAVISLLAIVEITSARRRSSTCLPLFDLDRDLFNPCLLQPCFLNKQSPPFIISGAPPLPPPGRPFRCDIRQSKYPNLRGIFFDILDEVPELQNAYCITTTGCTYDDLPLALDDMVAGGNYMGIVGDFMFLVPYRLSNTTIASVPYFNGVVMVYGRREDAKLGRSEGLGLVLSVFELSGWGVAGGFVILILVTKLFLACCYQPRNINLREWSIWRSVLRSMFGAYKEVPKQILEDARDGIYEAHAETNDQADSRFGFEFWSASWRSIAVAVLTIVLLNFEISIAVRIFDPKNIQLQVPLQNMGEERLREFVLVGDAGSEHKFREVADPKEQYSVNNPPWKQCTNESDCIAKIQNKNHPAKFGITYDAFHKYYLRSEDACDEFAAFNVRGNQPSYYTVWYFNTNVPEDLRSAINRKLTVLEENFRVKNLIAAEVPREDDPCGQLRHSINGWVLFGSLLFTIPFFLVIWGNIFLRCWIRCRIPCGRVRPL